MDRKRRCKHHVPDDIGDVNSNFTICNWGAERGFADTNDETQKCE